MARSSGGGRWREGGNALPSHVLRAPSHFPHLRHHDENILAAVIEILGRYPTGNSPGPQKALHLSPAPSPAKTNGAQAEGCAIWGGLARSSIMAVMERRIASERPMEGGFDCSSKAPEINVTVAADGTGQCEASTDLAPA